MGMYTDMLILPKVDPPACLKSGSRGPHSGPRVPPGHLGQSLIVMMGLTACLKSSGGFSNLQESVVLPGTLAELTTFGSILATSSRSAAGWIYKGMSAVHG